MNLPPGVVSPFGLLNNGDKDINIWFIKFYLIRFQKEPANFCNLYLKYTGMDHFYIRTITLLLGLS